MSRYFFANEPSSFCFRHIVELPHIRVCSVGSRLAGQSKNLDACGSVTLSSTLDLPYLDGLIVNARCNN